MRPVALSSSGRLLREQLPIPARTTQRTVTAAAATSGGADASRAEEVCWCAEPSYGIQNGTTAVPKANGPPDCVHTLQCMLLNELQCPTIGAQFCNWTANVWNGSWCAPTKGGPQLAAAGHVATGPN